jgi:hypothetical protein
MGRKPKFKRNVTTLECTYLASAIIEKYKSYGESKSDALQRILIDYANPDIVNQIRKDLEKKSRYLKEKSLQQQPVITENIYGLTTQKTLLDSTNISFIELSKKDFFTKSQILMYIAKQFNLTDEMADKYLREGLQQGNIQIIDDNCYVVSQLQQKNV